MKKTCFFGGISVVLFLVLAVPSLSFASINSDLKYGSHGADVIALQKFLVDKGFLQGQPTGNFFALTQKAVKAFQSANKISPTGYVGSLTRAKINNQSTGANPGVVSNLSSNTTAQQTLATSTAVTVPSGPLPSCTITGDTYQYPVSYRTDSTNTVFATQYGYTGTIKWTSTDATRGTLTSLYPVINAGSPIPQNEIASGLSSNMSLTTGADRATGFVTSFSNDVGSVYCTFILVSGNIYPLTQQGINSANAPISVNSGFATTTTTGSKKVEIASFTVTANSVEDLSIGGLFLGINGSVPPSGFKNLVFAQNINGTDFPMSYQNSPAFINRFGNFSVIPAGQSVVFDVFADIGTLTGQDWISFVVSGQGAGLASVNATGAVLSGGTGGQSITIQ